MGHMTARYYEQVKDQLHLNLNDFINYYRDGDSISLPIYHGCNRLNRHETRKEIECNLGYQCVIPTYKRYWRETKDEYKRKINDKFYWTRYMTRTNCRHLFRKKGSFVYNNYNYKLKKYEHMSETPMPGDLLFPVKKKTYLSMPLDKKYFIHYCHVSVKEDLNTDLNTSALML